MKPRALTRAATITMAWIVLATIGSELSAEFNGLLATIGAHDWIGKSIVSIIFFGLFYFIFAKAANDDFSLKDTWQLLLTTVFGGLIILIFYVMHA